MYHDQSPSQSTNQFILTVSLLLMCASVHHQGITYVNKSMYLIIHEPWPLWYPLWLWPVGNFTFSKLILLQPLDSINVTVLIHIKKKKTHKNRRSIDHFAIFNTNAHSLLKHKSEYDVLLDTINSVNFLDVISFTSGSDNNLDNLIEFDGYTPITKSQWRKVDIAVYVKDTTNYKIRNYLSLPIKKSHLYDGTVIEILQAPKW